MYYPIQSKDYPTHITFTNFLPHQLEKKLGFLMMEGVSEKFVLQTQKLDVSYMQLRVKLHATSMQIT